MPRAAAHLLVLEVAGVLHEVEAHAEPVSGALRLAAQPERVAKMKAAMEEAIAEGRTTPGPRLKNDGEILLVKPLPGSRPKGKAKE